jgi:hypothetical protein
MGQRKAPPGSSGIDAVAVAGIDLDFNSDEDNRNNHTAFLLVQRNGRWRLAEKLLIRERVGSSCEMGVGFRWAEGAGLVVDLRRVCRESLDQEELEAGESDVVVDQCLEARYRIVGDRIVLSSLDSKGLGDEELRAGKASECPAIRL